MADAERDENRIIAMIGVDKDDSEKTAKIAVNPVTLALIVEVARHRLLEIKTAYLQLLVYQA